MPIEVFRALGGHRHGNGNGSHGGPEGCKQGNDHSSHRISEGHGHDNDLELRPLHADGRPFTSLLNCENYAGDREVLFAAEDLFEGCKCGYLDVMVTVIPP